MLERRVLELGLGDSVEFDDRFLAINELADLLAASDVLVTPYHGREQIASGALAFAIAAGCGVVSLVCTGHAPPASADWLPFDDLGALASALCSYIEQPETLAEARTEARRIGTGLAWPSVAEATAAVLDEAHEVAPRRRPAGAAELHLTSLRSDHLLTLVDDVRIAQHTDGIIPNRDSGYCVDDVASITVIAIAFSTLAGDVSLRTAAYTGLGLSRGDADRLDLRARHLLGQLVEQLEDAYRSASSEGWSWLRTSSATTPHDSRRRCRRGRAPAATT